MIEIKSLNNLNQYANFETFDYDGKTIVLYDDHRCILTALFEARRLGIINDKTDVISFDMHDDARPVHIGWEKIQKFRSMGIENVSQRDFKNFVEFDIREYDDDWVTVGMELDLINNIVNIGNTECDNINRWKNHEYHDYEGKVHQGQTMGHLYQEFHSVGGVLGDSCRYSEFKTIRDVRGITFLVMEIIFQSGNPTLFLILTLTVLPQFAKTPGMHGRRKFSRDYTAPMIL